jgi:hypothetical protein
MLAFTIKGESMTCNQQRVVSYKKWWDELVERYGNVCFYCKKEISTTIDHVVPYSWDGDNSIDNLVPSCALCNSLASNKMFDTVVQKRAYILKQRNKYKNRRAICAECLLPFAYRTHSPSLFLCAECYDQEYGTQYSNEKRWDQWLAQLVDAGIMPTAHRIAKKKTGRFRLVNRGNLWPF